MSASSPLGQSIGNILRDSRTAGHGGAFADAAEAPTLSARDPGAQEMTISEMARAFGVSLRTLRFYEDRGLIQPRREGHSRFYSGAERTRLEMILKGKRLGFTLTEIRDLIGGQPTGDSTDFEEKLAPHQIVTQIGHLERQRSEIDTAIQRLRAKHERMGQAVGV